MLQTIGYMGHWFQIRKGRPEMVPVQIAEIVENAQKEFSTMQSQAISHQLMDISDLTPSPQSRGIEGVEVFLAR